MNCPYVKHHKKSNTHCRYARCRPERNEVESKDLCSGFRGDPSISPRGDLGASLRTTVRLNVGAHGNAPISFPRRGPNRCVRLSDGSPLRFLVGT